MESLQIAYVGVHLSAAAVISFVALSVRASIGGTAGRWFLAFMGLSAAWSTLEAVRIVAGTERTAAGLYIASLVVGLFTVAAFLVFVSAVTGRNFHLDARFRAGGAVALLAVTALKTTNPVHGLYFTLTTVETPFPHFAIELGWIHWVVTALAYVVSGVGMYYLYDLFRTSELRRGGLVPLFGLFAVPLGLTVYSQYGPGFPVDTFYEPIGVALFALALARTTDSGLGNVAPRARKHLIQQVEFPVAVVGDHEVIDSNDRFDAFADSGSLAGTPVEALPRVLRELLAGDRDHVALTFDGTRRIYRPSISEVTLGPHQLARAVVLFDVSEESQQLAEIRRQNRELENIGEAVAHELRNTSAIVVGHLDTVVGELDDESHADSVHSAVDAADRIDTVVGNLLSTLDHSRSVTTYERIDVRRTCAQFDAPGATVSVDDDGTLVGDTTRVEYLFENAFAFVGATETSAVRIDVGAGRLRLVFVDAGVAPEESDDVLEHGRSIPHAEAGMYLPTVGLIADAHHWCSTAEVRDPGDGPRELVVTIETDPSPRVGQTGPFERGRGPTGTAAAGGTGEDGTVVDRE